MINGRVQATALTDTLQLGGSGVGSFDVSNIGVTTGQYRRFGSFAKVDGSTWTLTGSNTLVLPWIAKNGGWSSQRLHAQLGLHSESGATLKGTGTLPAARR